MVDLNDPANWDTPLFPLVVVAHAALVAPDTLRKWIVRYGDDLKLWKNADGRAEANGLGHRFSLRDALHITAAARLIARGASVIEAYRASMHWVHVGEMYPPAVWANEPPPELVRAPAGLFADPAWTFLIHHGGDDARVVSVTRSESVLPFPFTDLFASGFPLRTVPAIVFLNDVDRHVRGVCEGHLRPGASPHWSDEEIAKLASGDE